MTERDRCVLLTVEDRRVPVRAVEEPVSAILDVPVAEARMIIRKGRGLLFEDLTPAKARSLQSAYEHAGVDVMVLPSTAVLGRIPIRSTRQLRPGDTSVRLQLGVDRELSSLPYANIDLVSAGLIGNQAFWARTRERLIERLPNLQKVSDQALRTSVSDVLSRHLPDAGANDGVRPDLMRELKRLIHQETRWVIDLYCTDVPVRYRLDRRKAVFPHIRVDADRSLRSDQMFLHVLTDLLLSLEDMPIPPQTSVLLQDPYQPGLVFDDDDAFERYTRWFFTMHRQGVQSGSGLLSSVNNLFVDPPDSPEDE